MIDLGLGGKRAIVSGAGYIPGRGGHGRQASLLLADAGATVACIDLNEDRARHTVDEIKAAGGSAFSIAADMTDSGQVETALDAALLHLGGIDICIDIIGMAAWNTLTEFSDEEWHWTIDNNLTHVFFLFRGASRRMISQGSGGSLVALSSADGIAAAEFHAPYGAAKAGVMGLVRSFAPEVGRHGIRVNAVAPGNVLRGPEDDHVQYGSNGINPLAPPRTLDIANAILFLSSSLSERITGQTIVVDGGATIRPLWDITKENVADFRARHGAIPWVREKETHSTD